MHKHHVIKLGNSFYKKISFVCCFQWVSEAALVRQSIDSTNMFTRCFNKPRNRKSKQTVLCFWDFWKNVCEIDQNVDLFSLRRKKVEQENEKCFLVQMVKPQKNSTENTDLDKHEQSKMIIYESLFGLFCSKCHFWGIWVSIEN